MGVPLEKLTLEAFLEWENAQDTRNEFHRGEVFAMVGRGARTAASWRTWRAIQVTRSTVHLAGCSTKQ